MGEDNKGRVVEEPVKISIFTYIVCVILKKIGIKIEGGGRGQENIEEDPVDPEAGNVEGGAGLGKSHFCAISN